MIRSCEFLNLNFFEKPFRTKWSSITWPQLTITVKEQFGIKQRRERLPKEKSQLAYGERLVRGKIVPFSAEHHVMQRMADLREQGLSYEKLASGLMKRKSLQKIKLINGTDEPFMKF